MILYDTTLVYFAKASICSNCHAVCHMCVCTHSSLACRAVRVCITCKECWHQLGFAHICVFSQPRLVATKNRLPQNSTYVLCGHMESGACCTCSATYTETGTGQHQGGAVFYCKEAHRTSGAWAILAHMKRSEVPIQLHPTITPQMLHQEQKYLSMLSTKLRPGELTTTFFKNGKVST